MPSCAGALLVLLAWAAFGPDSARAGCSHYARPRPALDGAAAVLTPADLTPPSTPEPPRRPLPCTGAMCSGHPAPPSSSAAPEVPRIGSWAILVTLPRPPAAKPSPLPFDERDVRSIHPASAIFHPPRAA